MLLELLRWCWGYRKILAAHVYCRWRDAQRYCCCRPPKRLSSRGGMVGWRFRYVGAPCRIVLTHSANVHYVGSICDEIIANSTNILAILGVSMSDQRWSSYCTLLFDGKHNNSEFTLTFLVASLLHSAYNVQRLRIKLREIIANSRISLLVSAGSAVTDHTSSVVCRKSHRHATPTSNAVVPPA